MQLYYVRGMMSFAKVVQTLRFCFILAALTAEEERLWSVVKENAADFNAWTALITETEKLVSSAGECLTSLGFWYLYSCL